MDSVGDNGIEGRESMDKPTVRTTAGIMSGVGTQCLETNLDSAFAQLHSGQVDFRKRYELIDVELTTPDDTNGSEISLDELLTRNLSSPACSEYDDDDFTPRFKDSSEKRVEPVGEPSSEPAGELASEPAGEPASEQTSEPAGEQANEPAGEPSKGVMPLSWNPIAILLKKQKEPSNNQISGPVDVQLQDSSNVQNSAEHSERSSIKKKNKDKESKSSRKDKKRPLDKSSISSPVYIQKKSEEAVEEESPSENKNFPVRTNTTIKSSVTDSKLVCISTDSAAVHKNLTNSLPQLSEALHTAAALHTEVKTTSQTVPLISNGCNSKSTSIVESPEKCAPLTSVLVSSSTGKTGLARVTVCSAPSTPKNSYTDSGSKTVRKSNPKSPLIEHLSEQFTQKSSSGSQSTSARLNGGDKNCLQHSAFPLETSTSNSFLSSKGSHSAHINKKDKLESNCFDHLSASSQSVVERGEKNNRSQTRPDSRSPGGGSSWVAPDASYYLKKYENNPKKLDNYEPGRSSVIERESYVSPFHNPPVEKPGENCKYTVVGGSTGRYSIRRTGQPISPLTSVVSQQYKMVQMGADIPFEGLHRPLPPPRLQSSLSPIDGGLIRSATRTNHLHPPVPAHQQRTVTSSISSGHVTPVKRHSVSVDCRNHHGVSYRPLSPLTGLEIELSRQRREAAKAVRKREMERVIAETRDRRLQQEEERNRQRRHSDNFPSSVRSPVVLDRYSFDEMPALCPKSPQSPTATTLRQPDVKARALYNFSAQSSRELSFHKGDVIYLLRRVDRNWFEGERHGSVGILPANYVEVIEVKESRPITDAQLKGGETFSAVAKFSFEAFDSSQLSFNKGDVLRVRERVDENWLRAELSGQTGLVPESYLELTRVASSDSMLLNTSSTSFTDSILLGSPGGMSSSDSSVLSSIPDFSIPAFTTIPNDTDKSGIPSHHDPYSGQRVSTGEQRLEDKHPARRNNSTDRYGHYTTDARTQTNVRQIPRGEDLTHSNHEPSWHSTLDSGYKTTHVTRPDQLQKSSRPRDSTSRDTVAHDRLTRDSSSGSRDRLTCNSSSGSRDRSASDHSAKRHDSEFRSKNDSYNYESCWDKTAKNSGDIRRHQRSNSEMNRQNRLTDSWEDICYNRGRVDSNERVGTRERRSESMESISRKTTNVDKSPGYKIAESKGVKKSERDGGGSSCGWISMPDPETMCILTPENRYGLNDDHTDAYSVPYQALYDYEPRNDDELGLRAGDLVYVTERFDDGWFVGISDRTSSFGMFPGNYVQKLRVRHVDLREEYNL